MSFTAKQIAGGVVEKKSSSVSHNHQCTCGTSAVCNLHPSKKINDTSVKEYYPFLEPINYDNCEYNKGVETQSSVPFRFNREKLASVLFAHKFLNVKDMGSIEWHWMRCDYDRKQRFLEIADAICAADKEIIERAD